MVTASQQERKGNKPPKWQRQGYSSYEEYLYHRQNRSGTSTGRYNPRHRTQIDHDHDLNQGHTTFVSAPEMAVIDQLVDALDVTVGRESAYPKDGHQSFLFTEKARMIIHLAGYAYEVEILSRWNVFDRLRYRLHFLTKGVYLAVTQEQLLRLLPNRPQVLPLQSGIFTSREGFQRAKARLAANWQRQLPKLERCAWDTLYLGFERSVPVIATVPLKWEDQSVPQYQ